MAFGQPPEDFDQHSLSARISMHLEAAPGLGMLLDVGLCYRADDPLVLRLAFELPGGTTVTWDISRDLLLAGLADPAGEGDVRVRPSPEQQGRVELRLYSTGGSACLLLPTRALAEVLLRSNRLVPFGNELSGTDLDRELELLLESSEN